MRTGVWSLGTVDAVENGASVDISGSGDRLMLQAIKTGTLTVALEGSLDGTTWDSLSADVADGLTAVQGPVKFVRLACSAFTSGSVSATIASVV